MKKTYQIPEIEVMLMETTELMQAASMSVYDEETSTPLSREVDMFFDDED